MSFTGIYQFGSLTTRNGETLSFSDVDKDGDGKISQQEFLFIQQELCLDTVELSEESESNAENNVTDEEYVSWAQEMQMKNALDELIAQIAQDFIGSNAKFAPQVIKELRYYFDGHTTITPKSDFIVFNIKELMNADENIRNALFFNILKYAWGLTLNRNVNTVLTVDEAHVLLSGGNTLGADFLAQIQRRARKYNTGTIIITQQPTDFSDPKVITQGKAIFDNASYYLVMGLKKQAVEDLSQLIDLNENEKDSIKHYSQGEALFVCGSRRMRINVAVTKDELDSFGSGGGF